MRLRKHQGERNRWSRPITRLLKYLRIIRPQFSSLGHALDLMSLHGGFMRASIRLSAEDNLLAYAWPEGKFERADKIADLGPGARAGDKAKSVIFGHF